MTLQPGTFVGLRVEMPDGSVVDILPDDIDAEPTNQGLFLDPEVATEALSELFDSAAEEPQP